MYTKPSSKPSLYRKEVIVIEQFSSNWDRKRYVSKLRPTTTWTPDCSQCKIPIPQDCLFATLMSKSTVYKPFWRDNHYCRDCFITLYSGDMAKFFRETSCPEDSLCHSIHITAGVK